MNNDINFLKHKIYLRHRLYFDNSIGKYIIETKEQLRDLILVFQFSEKDLLDFNKNYDYSYIKDMEDMFYNCDNILYCPDLDTSNVMCMNRMFYNCKNLVFVPNFNTDRLITAEDVFYGCDKLRKKPKIETTLFNNIKKRIIDNPIDR